MSVSGGIGHRGVLLGAWCAALWLFAALIAVQPMNAAVMATPGPSATSPAGMPTSTSTRPAPTPTSTPTQTATPTPSCRATPTPHPTYDGPVPLIGEVARQVAHCLDDAYTALGSDLTLTYDGAYLNTGGRPGTTVPYVSYAGGLLFRDVRVPRGAHITSARLRMWPWGWQDGVPVLLEVAGELDAQPADFHPANPWPHLRPKTTARTAWDISTTLTTTEVAESPDLAAVVQEILAQEGWQAGGDLALLVGPAQSQHYVAWQAYDFRPEHAAQLLISYEMPTPTPTVTLTPTPTATPSPCPLSTMEPFWVEPVTSPTDLLSQVITVRIGHGEAVTVTTASGVFTATGSFDVYSHPAQVAVSLLPDTIHPLRVEARVQQIIYWDRCIYGGYTISTDRDRYGAPLVIVQIEPTPTATPSPTPRPGLIVRGHVRRQGESGPGVPNVMVLLSLASYPPSASAFTDAAGDYEIPFIYIPVDEMVTVRPVLSGYAFQPSEYYWRHYAVIGVETAIRDFVAAGDPTDTPAPTVTPSGTPRPWPRQYLPLLLRP